MVWRDPSPLENAGRWIKGRDQRSVKERGREEEDKEAESDYKDNRWWRGKFK